MPPEPQAATQPLALQLAEMQTRLGQVEADARQNRLSMVVFSGSLDRIIASLVLATTAAASGMEVELFFTFWGLSALRDAGKKAKKTLIEKMFGWMLPRGTRKLPLSQMHMAGMGPIMMRKIMTQKNVASPEALLATAGELGVTIYACEMSMGVMGFKDEELIDYPHLSRCGAATFIDRAASGKVTLFI
ncbi:MAG TPA: DsrE/DsrF/DrsH-like family protein [Polyangia bacterium]|jgi:peroxiredoxin family protein